MTKLTDAQVESILTLREYGFKPVALAKMFGMKANKIRLILEGSTYKWVKRNDYRLAKSSPV